MNLKKTITATLVTGTLLFGSMTSAFAADVIVGGNGAGSHNSVNVNSNHQMDVYQKNYSDTSNFVLTNATTGGNSHVTSGAANASVGIINRGGSNMLSMNNCGCEPMASNIHVMGNGASSVTGVNVTSNHEMHKSQVNNTDISNTVITNAQTGGNNSSGNTGGNNSNWHPFMNTNNWMNTWNPSVHGWMLQNGWAWHNNMWVHSSNTGGSTSVSSGPASTNVGIYNGANTNVMH